MFIYTKGPFEISLGLKPESDAGPQNGRGPKEENDLKSEQRKAPGNTPGKPPGPANGTPTEEWEQSSEADFLAPRVT